MRREHYEQDARFAETHWWWAARRKILHRVLARFLPNEEAREVLEVGCSTGSNLPLLATFGRVSALEVDASVAEICKMRHPEIELFNQPIPERLPRRFDVICAFDVIEHIEDEARTVEWMHENLSDAGTIFVTVPAFEFLWSQYDEDAHHFRRYTRAGLVAALSARFDVQYVTYFNTHLFPIIALVRLLQRVRLIGLAGRDKEIGSRGAANRILYGAFVAETAWIPRFSLPVGVSLLAVAKRRPGRVG